MSCSNLTGILISCTLLSFLFLQESHAGEVKHYKLDTSTSSLKWIGRKVASSHSGTVAIKTGSVTFSGEKIVAGQFVIDMNSIKNDDIAAEDMRSKLERHLKSDDFFSAASFPEASFVIDSVVQIADTANTDDYTVSGKLTVKGIENPLEFPAVIRAIKGGYTAYAKFTFDRSKWQIRYNSSKFFDLKQLGDRLIYDDVEIELNLKALAKS